MGTRLIRVLPALDAPRSKPNGQERIFPLDAAFRFQLLCGNRRLPHSSRLGRRVLPKTDAVGSVLFVRRATNSGWNPRRKQAASKDGLRLAAQHRPTAASADQHGHFCSDSGIHFRPSVEGHVPDRLRIVSYLQSHLCDVIVNSALVFALAQRFFVFHSHQL